MKNKVFCALYGTLGGDFIGSVYEGQSRRVDSWDFPLLKNGCRLTDDSVLTIATADKLLHGDDYSMFYRKWGQRYSNAGFSHTFSQWFMEGTPQPPYGAHSNGSVMRCSPIGFACDSIEEVLEEAERSAAVSHSHPEGIKGAQAGALAVFLARKGNGKDEIRREMEQRFKYVFNSSVNELRGQYLNASCECTLPVSLQAFFESDSYESAVRNAIYLGGDSDTFAAIAGSVALAFYKEMPSALINAIEKHLTDEMREVCREFAKRFPLELHETESFSANEPPCRWRANSWKISFNEAVWRARSEDMSEILHNMRGGVFQNTVSVVRSGGYYSEKHFCVKLPEPTDMIRGTCFYSSELPPCRKEALPKPTGIEILNEDCLVAAKSLKDNSFNPAVLNMASSRNPGGGVLNGAGAQEENLFRRTNLFLSMYQFASYAEYYGVQKSSSQYPLDQNFGGVYTPDACVFRGLEKDGYPLLDEYYKMSFIAVPAMNRPELDAEGRIVPRLVDVIKNKMRMLFRIGLLKGHDSLVLGAWGCGAFRNPPAHIARLFHEVLEEEEFKDKYRKIVFAIIEDHNSRKEHNPEGNLLPFQKEFEHGMGSEDETEQDHYHELDLNAGCYFLPFEKDGKFGVIEDHSHKIVLPPIYEKVDLMHDKSGRLIDNIVNIKKNGRWHLYRLGVGIIQNPSFSILGHLHAGVYHASFIGCLHGFIDESNNIVLPFIYADCKSFSEGLCAVKWIPHDEWDPNDGWGYIDREGKCVIRGKYADACKFHNGYARVKKEAESIFSYGQFLSQTGEEGDWGIIDTKGNELLPCSHALPFVHKELHRLRHPIETVENGGLSDYAINKEKIAIARDFVMVVDVNQHVLVLNNEYGTLINAANELAIIKTWRGIRAVAAGFDHGMGITNYGSIVTTGNTREFTKAGVVGEWHNVRFLDGCEGHVAAITYSGEIKIATETKGYEPPTYYKKEIEALRNPVKLAVGWQHAAVLMDDGTVKVVGEANYPNANKVDQWRDVVDIDVFGCYYSLNQTVGLTKNGRVLYAANYDNGPDDWRDIVSISCGDHHIVGLDKNGKVHACGRNDARQCNVDDWPEMICVKGDFFTTVGIDKQGWIWITPMGRTNFRIFTC